MRLRTLLASVALTVSTSAQSTTTLLLAGEPLPGLSGGTVTSIGDPAANASGGFVCVVGVSTAQGNREVLWGSPDGGSGDVLFDPLDAIWGLPAISPGGDATWGGFDAVRVDGVAVLSAGAAVPGLPGATFSVFQFLERTGTSFTFKANIDDGGASRNGLFQGASGTPLFLAGDTVPGVPLPLDSIPVGQWAESASGAHVAALLRQDHPTVSDDEVIVIDGAPLVIEGQLTDVGGPLPPSMVELPWEDWLGFEQIGVTDDGSYALGALSIYTEPGPFGNSTITSFALVDDEVVIRTGGTAGPGYVVGGLQSVPVTPCYSENRDLALPFFVDGPQGSKQAVLFNGRPILFVGDPLDTDFDGLVDPASSLSTLPAIGVTTDRRVIAQGFVQQPGFGSRSILFAVEIDDLVADGDALSVGAGGAVGLTLFTRRDVEVDWTLLLASISGTTPGFVVDGVAVPLNVDAILGYTAANPISPLFPNGLAVPDDLGVVDASVELPAGAPPILVGLGLSVAYVTLADAGGGLQVTSASNAVGVALQP